MRIRQKVEVSMCFSDTAHELTLMQIFQKNNMLIAVSRHDAKGLPGEAMTTCYDAAWVEVEAAKELEVKHYIVNKSGRLERLNKNYTEVNGVQNIQEIVGLQALVLEKVRGEEKDAGLYELDEVGVYQYRRM